MVTILQGDCLEVLRRQPDESVNCCVTSPPYWGLRDYGVEGQIGLEPTPAEYVAKMVAVFTEVRRVLRRDGTCWVNLGDSYAQSGGVLRGENETKEKAVLRQLRNGNSTGQHGGWESRASRAANTAVGGLKPKDLCGIPWRVAFALQADGWYLRSDIIWHKPNPMPESVTDRPTKAHEYIFLLTKSERYAYDAEAIKDELIRPEESTRKTPARFGGAHKWEEAQKQSRLHSGNEYLGTTDGRRNKRTVWTVPTSPYKEAHFATFPPDLIKPCILAGCPVGGTVLDPFGGSGTTGMVATELGREAILIELNPKYVDLIKQRTNVTLGLALA